MPGLRVRVASKRRCQTGEGPHWDEKAQALLYVDCYAGCVSRLDPETHEDIDTIHFGKPVLSFRGSNTVFEDGYMTEEYGFTSYS